MFFDGALKGNPEVAGARGVSSWILEGQLKLIMLRVLVLFPTTGKKLMLCGKGSKWPKKWAYNLL